MNDPLNVSMPSWTLRDYIRVIFRHKMVVITSVMVITSMVIFACIMRTPMYQANVKMLITGEKQVESLYYKELMALRNNEVSLTQSEIVTSEPVLRTVVDALRLYNKPVNYERDFASPIKSLWIRLKGRMYRAKIEHLPAQQQTAMNYRRALDELRGSISVDPIRDTNIFIIRVRDFDRVGAAVLANVVSRAYVAFDLEQQLAELQQKYGEKHAMVIQLQDNITRMKASLTGKPLSNEEALGAASVKIVEQASVPYRPIGGSNKLLVLAAFFASLFLGVILAFIFEYLDQSIKSPQDVEKVLNLPLVGTIPLIRARKNTLVNKDIQKTPKKCQIAFTQLANQLRLIMHVKSFKTVLLTSTDANEGASTIIANLGLHITQGEVKRVLILDANFSQPSMQAVFNVPPSPGFVDVIAGQVAIDKAIVEIKPGLFLMPAGKTNANPVIFLDSPRIKNIIEELKTQFDLILIDCAALNATHEALLLASCVDKTIFIVSENETRRPVALNQLTKLEEHNASMLGAILNKRTYPIPAFVYRRV